MEGKNQAENSRMQVDEVLIADGCLMSDNMLSDIGLLLGFKHLYENSELRESCLLLILFYQIV